MASFMSDGFQEALGESMTALKFGDLVLKEKQKAALYARHTRQLSGIGYFEKARCIYY